MKSAKAARPSPLLLSDPSSVAVRRVSVWHSRHEQQDQADDDHQQTQQRREQQPDDEAQDYE